MGAETSTDETNKHNTKPEKKSQKVAFKIHIAIDFGTDGCALAFAYKDKVTVYNKWKTKKRQRSVKAKAQILLNDKNQVIAFGDNAKIIYSSLSGIEKTKWKFFDRFKMSLYGAAITEEEEKKQNNNNDQSIYLKTINNIKCKPDIVFIRAFQHLQQIAMEYMNKITNGEEIKNDEIQWIVTVPAIWSEKAKSKMKKWIIRAKLVDKNIKDQCLIVYEPDCAALSIFEQIKNGQLHIGQNNTKQPVNDTNISTVSTQNNIKETDEIKESGKKINNDFNIGDKYILIDAGGGTMDVVCHKVVENGVEEINYPTGGKWGGCYVDDEYIKILKKIFSKEWINEFKKSSPNIYLEIIDLFQRAKLTFFKTDNAQTHHVELPYEFVQYLHQKSSESGIDLETKISQYKQYLIQTKMNKDDDKEEQNDKICVDLEDELLTLDIKIWKQMFDKLLNKTIQHIHSLLKQQSYNYLCLVGGFSACKYFQVKMNNEFGMKSKYKMGVIIPPKPTLSVVIGAAYFGIRQQFIKARILKYTYGMHTNYSLSYARQIGVTEEHIKRHTINRRKGGEIVKGRYVGKDEVVEKCFHVIKGARKGDRVDINTRIKQRSTAYVGMPDIVLLCSHESNPMIVSDKTAEFAKLELNLDITRDNREIVTIFHFYGTMFRVSTYTEDDSHTIKVITINYGK